MVLLCSQLRIRSKSQKEKKAGRGTVSCMEHHTGFVTSNGNAKIRSKKSNSHNHFHTRKGAFSRMMEVHLSHISFFLFDCKLPKDSVHTKMQTRVRA